MFDPTPNLQHGYGGLFILVAFFGAMLWMMWFSRRRAQFGGGVEVSATAQARLAQEARAMYVSPEYRLCNIDTPSEFDSHVLSLFDSIEGNRDDIDAKLESLRVYLGSSGNIFERLKNKQKLNLVYGNMAAYLVRPRSGQSRLGMQQLLADWGKVGRLAGSDGPWKVPKTWIRPLVNDFVPDVSSTDFDTELSSTGTGTSRKASSMSNGFSAFLTIASLVLFVLSVVFSARGLSPYGLPGGAFFAAGCVFLGLAMVFHPRHLPPRRR
jgi:hypothetical protein